MSNPTEPRIEALVKAQAVPAASDDLKRRVSELASLQTVVSPRRQASSLRFRLAVAAGSAAFALCGILIMAPSITAANTLNALSDAVDGAKSMHLKMFDVTGGGQSVQFETWYQNGQYRVADDHGYLCIWKSGVSYSYDPIANAVIKKAQPDGPFAHHLKGFKMSQIISDMTGGSRGKNIEISKSDGPTYRVQFDNSRIQERYIFVVNSKSDLPISMEVQTPKAGVWIKREMGEFEFNSSLPDSLFKPTFAKTAKLIDADAYSASLAEEFHDTIAVLPNGSKGGGLKIRKVLENGRGQVFIVYSGRSPTMNRWLELTDDRGTNYVRADTSSQGEFQDRSLPVPGTEGLRVGWWVPEEGHGAFHSAKFTLTFKKQREFDSPGPGQPMYAKQETVGATSLTVSEPSPGEVPLFMNVGLTPELPKSDLDLRKGESYSLYLFYMHRFFTKDGKPLSYHGIYEGSRSDGYYRDPNDLIKALGFANEELAIATKETKQSDNSGLRSVYDQLFMVNRLLGRIAESDAYLQKAEALSESEQKNASVWIEYENRLGNIPANPITP